IMSTVSTSSSSFSSPSSKITVQLTRVSSSTHGYNVIKIKQDRGDEMFAISMQQEGREVALSSVHMKTIAAGFQSFFADQPAARFKGARTITVEFNGKIELEQVRKTSAAGTECFNAKGLTRTKEVGLSVCSSHASVTSRINKVMRQVLPRCQSRRIRPPGRP